MTEEILGKEGCDGLKNIDKMAILLIVLAIITFIIVLMVNIIPNKNDKKIQVNYELSEESIVYLLKCMQKYVHPSELLIEKSFTNEEMIGFAVSYMEIEDGYKNQLVYDKDEEIVEVDKNKLLEVINWIFEIDKIDFDAISYKTTETTVFVPRIIQGGDAQIYKYKTTEYNKVQDTYVAYIDCLEASKDNTHEILSATQIEYPESEVICQILLKYKIMENRKVLLSYNIKNNVS